MTEDQQFEGVAATIDGALATLDKMKGAPDLTEFRRAARRLQMDLCEHNDSLYEKYLRLSTEDQ